MDEPTHPYPECTHPRSIPGCPDYRWISARGKNHHKVNPIPKPPITDEPVSCTLDSYVGTQMNQCHGCKGTQKNQSWLCGDSDKLLLSCCLTSTEARWPIRDGDRVGRERESERLDRGNRPKKTGETVDRRQNNGIVKAVSPRHCPATCALCNCCFNCCAGQSH